MKLWECPQCGSTNKLSMAFCFCGYEAQGNEKEVAGQQQVKVAPLGEDDIQRINEEASGKIKAAAYILYVIAGLQIIAGVSFSVFGNASIVDGIIIAILTVIFHKFKSRIVAIALFLVVPMSMLIDKIMLISANRYPHLWSLLFNILILAACFNAVVATFVFRRSKK